MSTNVLRETVLAAIRDLTNRVNTRFAVSDHMYDTTADGLAATVVGERFSAPDVFVDPGWIIVYEHATDGTATEVYRYPTAKTVLAARDAAQAAQAGAETAQTGAVNAKTAAETAKAATEAVFDNFDDRFLGTKTADPTLDNDGAALLVGAIYFNSTTSEARFYNGTAWEAPTTLAKNSATNAAASASAAATSETNAAGSATNASNSATAASSAKTAAETALDTFDDRWLGAKTAAPTLDNDGAALLVGAVYFNTTDNTHYSWNGTAWVPTELTIATNAEATAGTDNTKAMTPLRVKEAVSVLKAGDAELLDGLNSTQFARTDAAQSISGTTTFTAGGTNYHGASLWYVSASDAAHQRADARDDATNFARLHWYGLTDTNGVSNARHAFYDGAAYVQMTAESGGINFHGFTGDLKVNGNKVWHAGNDGTGSGLDADLLDGFGTSQDTTASTVAVRDAAGDLHARLIRSAYTVNEATITADAAIMMRKSTTDNWVRPITGAGFVSWLKGFDGAGSGLDADLLDGRDSSQFETREYQVGALNRPVGWYTIATTGSRASATFRVRDITSGRHQFVEFTAGINYGVGEGINILQHSKYALDVLGSIRIKSGGTYDGAALQIYIGDTGNEVAFEITGDFQSPGWVPANWVADATDPGGGVANYATMTIAAEISLGRFANGTGFATTGEIYAGDLLNPHKVWHAGNDGAGSGLDADKLDGRETAYGVAADTIAVRDGSADLTSRLFRSTYPDATGIQAAATVTMRVNNGTDNYHRSITGAGFKAWEQGFQRYWSGYMSGGTGFRPLTARSVQGMALTGDGLHVAIPINGIYRISWSVISADSTVVDARLHINGAGAAPFARATNAATGAASRTVNLVAGDYVSAGIVTGSLNADALYNSFTVELL